MKGIASLVRPNVPSWFANVKLSVLLNETPEECDVCQKVREEFAAKEWWVCSCTPGSSLSGKKDKPEKEYRDRKRNIVWKLDDCRS